MKRSSTGLLATASLVVGAAACAHNGFAPIAVTKDATVVAKCQSMGEVQVTSDTPSEEAGEPPGRAGGGYPRPWRSRPCPGRSL